MTRLLYIDNPDVIYLIIMRERDPSDQETREREADNLIKSPIRSNSNFHPFCPHRFLVVFHDVFQRTRTTRRTNPIDDVGYLPGMTAIAGVMAASPRKKGQQIAVSTSKCTWILTIGSRGRFYGRLGSSIWRKRARIIKMKITTIVQFSRRRRRRRPFFFWIEFR